MPVRVMWPRRLMLGAIVVAVAVLAGMERPARADPAGPSFTCPGHTQVEAIICSDVQLSVEDRQLTALYDLSHRAAFGKAPSQELAAQRVWLKNRDACDQRPSDERRSCIDDYYHDRLVALARATMFTDPDGALRVLHAVEPQTEPIYRAMYLYATIDDPKRRTQAVAPLIKPFLDRLYAHAVVKAPGVESLVASDKAFGGFVAETWTHIENTPGFAWPCGVLVRRPGLIDALGPHYGGAIDGAIPGADCNETAPEIAGMDELIQAAWNAVPSCEGTIRFTTGRAYAELEVAVRLHRPSVWTRFPVQKPDAKEQTFRTTTAAYIRQVTGVLTIYYIGTLGIAPATARRDASGAVDHLIDDAFNSCGGDDH